MLSSRLISCYSCEPYEYILKCIICLPLCTLYTQCIETLSSASSRHLKRSQITPNLLTFLPFARTKCTNKSYPYGYVSDIIDSLLILTIIRMSCYKYALFLWHFPCSINTACLNKHHISYSASTDMQHQSLSLNQHVAY